MKILKPDNLALLYRNMRFAQRNSLSIGMMACFRFEKESVAQPTLLLPESELWTAAAHALGDTLLDEGYPKPVGEFKVYGAACAPSGTLVAQQRVSVRVGTLSKSLIVSGDRHLNVFGAPSAPKPYGRMPIDPSTAFGGPGNLDNPCGKGYAEAECAGQRIWPLHNVEAETERVVVRGERAAPAGFWGFDAIAPLRSQYLGACDDRWLKCGWPQLPVDTSPELFQCAPPDQRLKGFFAGNETFEIANMHPEQAVLQGRLPALRARCFVNTRESGTAGRLREVEARAETVWLFPELECGIVLYRAVAEVCDAEATDVLHLMMCWESLNEPPLPFEHYADEFLRSLPVSAHAKPVAADITSAAAAAVPAADEIATWTAVEAATVRADELPLPEGFDAVHAMAADLDRQTQAVMAQQGVTEIDLDRFLEPSVPPPVHTFPEIEKMVEDLNLRTRALMRENNLTDADLERVMKASQLDPEPDFSQIPTLQQQLDQQTENTLRKAGLTEADVYKQLGSLPELAGMDKSLSALGPNTAMNPEVLGMLAQINIPADAPSEPAEPSAVASPAVATLPDSRPVTTPRQFTRDDVIAWHATGKCFAGYDLTGLDLSALDLSGADFSEAMLEGTSFARSNLCDSKFVQALLRQTNFAEADLQRAKLLRCSGGAGKFTSADLRDAQLGGGDFSKVDFSAARLDRADLANALFDGSTMAGVNASACHAPSAQFIGCDLSGADFSGALLTRASFVACKLTGSNFTAAACDEVDFQGAQAQGSMFVDATLRASRADASSCFDGAQFVRAQLDRASWDGAQLRGAVLDGAVIDSADFSNVKARAARFRQASAKGAKFSKADLCGADLSLINLFRGSLRKASLDGTLLRSANLYAVDFEDTQPTIACLEGANIDRTILRFRPPVI